MAQQRRVQDSFKFTIKGEFGNAIFIAQEVDKSQNYMEGTSSVVYKVSSDPHLEAEFHESIGLWEKWGIDINSEFVIGANVWNLAGWTRQNDSFIKRWPVECIKVAGANEFMVTLKYGPLFVTNFQTSPIKTKRKISVGTPSAWRSLGDNGWTRIDFLLMGLDERRSYSNINTDKNGVVHGVDVIEPTFTWTERWIFGPLKSLITNNKENYNSILADTTATVNQSKFRGLEKKCVLFLGAVGRNVNPFTIEIDYKFSYKPPTSEIPLGFDYIAKPVNKRGGWYFVDDNENQQSEGINNEPRTVPHSIKLHQVYESRNFGRLGTAPQVPLGYGTSLDTTLNGIGPNVLSTTSIGTAWTLPEWAEKG